MLALAVVQVGRRSRVVETQRRYVLIYRPAEINGSAGPGFHPVSPVLKDR